MRRIFTVLSTAVLLGLGGVLAAPASPACACSCVAGTDEAYEKSASVVFEGNVLGTRDTGGEDFREVEIKFEVVAVDKGQADKIVYVYTNRSEASCGTSFGTSHTYRVYARKDGDQLITTLCSGNKLLRPKGRTPTGDGRGAPEADRTTNWVALGAAGGGLLLLGAGALWFVRRQPKTEP